VWFLAIYLVSQAKTGLSALALKRYLGVSYPTAWLVHHKLMQAMVEREAGYVLSGKVEVDDAYLGGELSGGTAGRCSEKKVPFVAAVSLDPAGHPLRAKLTPVPGFTLKAIAAWANAHLSPGSCVVSDGLACFVGVGEAGCQHLPIVVGGRKPKDLPDFHWVNTVLGNVNPSLSPTPSLPRIFNELAFFRGRLGHYICETSARGSMSVFSVLPGRWGSPRAL